MTAQSPPPLPRLLSAADVSAMTGIPRWTLYEMTRRGELPAVRIGTRHYRFSAPAIRQWIDAGGVRGDGV